MVEMSASVHDDQVVQFALLAPVRLVCESLVEALSHESDVALLQHGTTVPEVAVGFPDTRRLVLVFDGSSAESLNALRETIDRLGAERVVVFGLSEDARQLRQCAKHNVSGLVARGASLKELVSAIVGVAREGHYASQMLSCALLRALATDGPNVSYGLTDRENEVAQLLARGDPSSAICRTLGLRPGTLKSHVRSIYSKLGIHHRSEIAGRLPVTPRPEEPGMTFRSVSTTGSARPVMRAVGR